jgi:hypothetical protein
VLPRLLARDGYFCAVAKPAEKFFTVLPAESKLSDVSKAEPTDDVGEKIDIGLIKVGIHHCALGPIDQFSLAQFVVQVVSNFIGDDSASDFHG